MENTNDNEGIIVSVAFFLSSHAALPSLTLFLPPLMHFLPVPAHVLKEGDG